MDIGYCLFNYAYACKFYTTEIECCSDPVEEEHIHVLELVRYMHLACYILVSVIFKEEVFLKVRF